jgi:hypothetical protein
MAVFIREPLNEKQQGFPQSISATSPLFLEETRANRKILPKFPGKKKPLPKSEAAEVTSSF